MVAEGEPVFDLFFETPWDRTRPAEGVYREALASTAEGLSFFAFHFNAPGDFEVVEPEFARYRTDEYALFSSGKIKADAGRVRDRAGRHARTAGSAPGAAQGQDGSCVMTYANGRVICDADSHLMELPDFLTAHADPADRERMPPMGSLRTGQFNPAAHIGKTGHDPDALAQLLALGDGLTRGPKWHDALGSFSGAERSVALDMLGFERQVIFASFCARPIFEAEPDVRYGAARAHNRAMAAFCGGDKRLIGVAMVPLDDVAQALAEIERAHALGLGAVWVAAAAAPPGGRSPGHVDHEPDLGAAGRSRACPFILHVGSSPLSIESPWMNDGRPDRRTARGGRRGSDRLEGPDGDPPGGAEVHPRCWCWTGCSNGIPRYVAR